MVESYVHLNGKIMLHCISLGKHTTKQLFLMSNQQQQQQQQKYQQWQRHNLGNEFKT